MKMRRTEIVSTDITLLRYFVHDRSICMTALKKSCMAGRNISSLYVLKSTHSLSSFVVLQCFYLQNNWALMEMICRIFATC